MKTICLIGNNGFGKPVFDGQRIKVRTYKRALESEGFVVNLVDLESPIKHLFKIFSSIKKGIKKCDIIVLIASDNGEKILIPFINKINKKYKKRFIFSQIGTSFLYHYIKPLTEEQKESFFNEYNFLDLKPKNRIIRNLKSIDAILTETELINNAFSKFFSLNNCYFMTNFRFVEQPQQIDRQSENKLVYLSRVTERKGIFDLLNVLNKLATIDKKVFSLDIFGSLYMTNEEIKKFNSMLNERIVYRGELSQDSIISTLQKYDYLCFPTKCEGEGTPGCVIESLIAGIPVLSSSFTQSLELLKNNCNSLIFKFGNKNDLREKLLSIFNNNDLYQCLRLKAYESGKEFTYLYNRERFLKIIKGE